MDVGRVVDDDVNLVVELVDVDEDEGELEQHPKGREGILGRVREKLPGLLADGDFVLSGLGVDVFLRLPRLSGAFFKALAPLKCCGSIFPITYDSFPVNPT